MRKKLLYALIVVAFVVGLGLYPAAARAEYKPCFYGQTKAIIWEPVNGYHHVVKTPNPFSGKIPKLISVQGPLWPSFWGVKDGQLVTQDGRRVNENGRYVDNDNNLIDRDGNRVDEDGNLVDNVTEIVD